MGELKQVHAKKPNFANSPALELERKISEHFIKSDNYSSSII